MSHLKDNYNPPACPINETHAQTEFAFRVGAYSLYRCSVCKHLWVHPIPTEDELRAFYSKSYFMGDPNKRGYKNYEEDKKSVQEEFVYFLDILESTTKERRLLDIGAATGVFLECAAKRGWQVQGIEISEYAALEARKKGLDVRLGTLEEHVANFAGMPVITLWDVVEHLRDPKIAFLHMSAGLPENGLIMFATPQSDSLFARLLGRYWTLLAPPQHLHYFSKESLQELLNLAGLELVSMKWRGKVFGASYIIHFVMGWWGISWKWLVWLTERKWIQKLHLRINPHDAMIVLVRKRAS